MMRAKRHAIAGFTVVMAAFAAAASAQQLPAVQLLESVANAMGGRERLLRLENFTYTGFGQQLYQDGGGNSTGDINAPPKWRALADAQRSFDLKSERAISQERRNFLFPLAAPFGHNWALVTTQQSGADLMDHPLPAVLEAMDAETKLGPVTVEGGNSVLQFTTADGTTVWMGVNRTTNLPLWTRRIIPHINLGDVALTTHFTGYVPYDGIPLPLGLVNRIDWRNQMTLMFHVDSYRLNLAQQQIPTPSVVTNSAATPAVINAAAVRLGKGAWDVRVNNYGGPVIEFADHLVMFEAGGSSAQTLARIDAANKLVPGKKVTAVIVSHHHFDHTAGLRAAVSRGLSVISHRGNEPIIRDMIERPAIVFPDDLAKSPHPLKFVPVDEQLVLQDATQRLEIYHVLGHSHMANAVFAYLPAARVMMEGDLGDAEWTWHWWAAALATNIKAYGIQPQRNIAVHGKLGGLTIEETLANNQRQSEVAQKFCAQQRAAGIGFLGCPVQYDASGPLPLPAR